MYIIDLKVQGGIAGISEEYHLASDTLCEYHLAQLQNEIDESRFFSPTIQSFPPMHGADIMYKTLTIHDTNTGISKTVKNNPKMQNLMNLIINFSKGNSGGGGHHSHIRADDRELSF